MASAHETASCAAPQSSFAQPPTARFLRGRLHHSTDPTPDHRPRLGAGVPSLGAFLANFDVTAVVVAMPATGRDLGLGAAGLAWVSDAYSIACVAALLAAGALADRFGRRRALLLGNVLFLGASLACGLAPARPHHLGCALASGPPLS